jgi:hypothetical protein
MEALFIAAVIAASNVLCFIVGARVGQKVVKGEQVEMPDPIQAIRNTKTKIEAYKEQDRMDILWQNIESYDGTSNGQRDVPRG